MLIELLDYRVTAIAVGIAAGLVGVLASVGFFFFIRKRKAKKPGSFVCYLQ